MDARHADVEHGGDFGEVELLDEEQLKHQLQPVGQRDHRPHEPLGAETGPATGADALLLGLSSRVSALDTRREGLGVVAASAEAELLRETGVDLDAEAANLVRLQQAFEANSRVIQVATELFDTLLGLR